MLGTQQVQATTTLLEQLGRSWSRFFFFCDQILIGIIVEIHSTHQRPLVCCPLRRLSVDGMGDDTTPASRPLLAGPGPSSHAAPATSPVKSSGDGDSSSGSGGSSGGSATVFGSIVTLCATSMGAGVLSLPKAMAYGGWAFGFASLAVYAILSDYSLMLLLKAGRACNKSTLVTPQQHTLLCLHRCYSHSAATCRIPPNPSGEHRKALHGPMWCCSCKGCIAYATIWWHDSSPHCSW